MSLNDKLMQGPDFTSTLVGVMTRFRQAPIPLMSDIESKFHQVEVAPDHCDALRFLEWPENDMERQPQDYRLKVFPCGAVCSPSCAGYALRRTAQGNEGLFPPEVIETVNRNFYVDDSLELVTDKDSAASFVPKLGPLLPSAGFHLTMWLPTSWNYSWIREGEVYKGCSVRCHAFSTGPWRQVESRVRHIWFQSEG